MLGCLPPISIRVWNNIYICMYIFIKLASNIYVTTEATLVDIYIKSPFRELMSSLKHQNSSNIKEITAISRYIRFPNMNMTAWFTPQTIAIYHLQSGICCCYEYLFGSVN